MANWYINSVAYAAVAQWAASHTYSAGAIVRQLAAPAAGGERCFRTAAGGVSGSTEPTWCTVPGGVTRADNTVTDWTEISGSETYQAAGAWAAPLARLPQQGMSGAGTPAAVGSAWVVGDLGTVGGGTFTKAAILKVNSVTSGHPTSWSIYDPGVYTAAPAVSSAVTAISPGVGTGATLSTTILTTIGTTRGAAGDNFFVSSNHAETQTGAQVIQTLGTLANPCWMICVDETGSGAVPPTSANLKTTATVTNTSVGITFVGSLHTYGLSFTAASNFAFTITASLDEHQIMEQGTLSLSATAIGAFMGSKLLTGLSCAKVEWINVVFNPTFTSNVIAPRGVNFSWRNNGSAAALKAGSAVPVTLITPTFNNLNAYGGSAELDGLDLSLMTSGTIFGAPPSGMTFSTIMRNCKLAGTTVVSATPANPATEIYNYNCDTGNTNYRSEKYAYRGTETTNTSVTRVGGASDGVTQQSRKIVTTANAVFAAPFRSMPLMIWNDLVGSTRNVTLYGTINAGSPPANNELWLECEYFEDASSPLASFVDNKMLYLGTPASQSADGASTWNGGGSGAGWSPFSLSVSFTAQQHGYIVMRICAAKASTTYYIDPPGAGTLS